MRILILLTLSLITMGLFSQDYIWPVQGKNIGENILFKPQDLIGDELNFDALFISAKEDEIIVSPCNGIITDISLTIMNSLNSSCSFENPIDSMSLENIKFGGICKGIEPIYLNMSICISRMNNERIYINGLKPSRKFKTGYKIKKGEVIGRCGYAYKEIKQPCICLSRSISSKCADPMSIFGLKSTFVQYKASELDINAKMHQDSLKKDFVIFKQSLEQGYPGLYDYITKKELDSLFKTLEDSIKQPLSPLVFYNLIYSILGKIHDSHFGIDFWKPIKDDESIAIPAVFFGFLDDTLLINRTLPEYQDLLGKRIINIDGVNFKTLKKKIITEKSFSDGFISSRKLLGDYYNFWYYYGEYFKLKSGDTINLNLEDGIQVKIPYFADSEDLKYFPKINRFNPDIRFKDSLLNNNTAYLDINTFDLYQKDIDEIVSFIRFLADSSYENLIIDLRNNRGGDEKVLCKLFSFIATKPFYQEVFRKVNRNSVYPFFKYTLNYSSQMVLFENYIKQESKDDFYLSADSTWQYYPDDSTHYDGNIIVLTNESSLSAASMFASFIRRYNRGIVVGRETGSCYHQMKALSFARVLLPRSEIIVTIPLVKCVFDTLITERNPWGRGVIPDFFVKLSIEELILGNDEILTLAINLGDTLDFDLLLQEAVVDKEKDTSNQIILLIVVISCVFGAILFILKRRKL
ncbi:MAG: hypothetical protein K9J13_14080 [Saprospiraceae bacterium]|nr:hypothetical protein [Saprospiraceae bacterium]